jgi:acid phosphatase family membrane protein YuiD
MSTVLIISVCAWAVAQLLKIIIALAQKKRVDLSYLVTSGGMPSAHSTTVSALATAVGIVEGFGSVAFGIAAIVSLVVMYDAAGVRRSVGKQSVVLNRIMQELRSRRPVAELEHDLREFIGHSPFQVIIGAALGIAMATLWLALIAT